MLRPQLSRFFCDNARKNPPVDINQESETPKLWNGANAAFALGLGQNGVIETDVSNIATLKLEVFESQTTSNPALISATLSAIDLNQALTQEAWDAATDQHALIEFPHEEMELELGAESQKNFWLKVSASTIDDPAKFFPLLEGNIIFLANPNSNNDGPVQGGNIIPQGVSYNGAGHYTVNVTADKVYQLNRGANDTSVTNGLQTVAADIKFTTQGATITLNGTANATVTAVIRTGVFLDNEESDARYHQKGVATPEDLVTDGKGYRFTNGQFQIWDDTAAGWRALVCNNGQLSTGNLIAD